MDCTHLNQAGANLCSKCSRYLLPYATEVSVDFVTSIHICSDDSKRVQSTVCKRRQSFPQKNKEPAISDKSFLASLCASHLLCVQEPKRARGEKMSDIRNIPPGLLLAHPAALPAAYPGMPYPLRLLLGSVPTEGAALCGAADTNGSVSTMKIMDIISNSATT